MKLRDTFLDIGKQLDNLANPAWLSAKTANVVLGLILLLIATIRLSIIQTPALDRTEWKEIDYLTISENYQKNGYDFLHPQVSWPAETPRITAMELPVVPFMAGLLYPVFGKNVYSVRIIPLIAYLLIILFTFKLVKRETGVLPALLAALFVGIFPLGNFYRHYLFSEPVMIFFSVFAVYQYAEWMDYRKLWNLLLFIGGFSLALALKPTSLYLGLPLLWIYFRKYQFEWKKAGNFVFPMALSLVLPVLWFAHAYNLANNYIDVFGVFGGKFGGHDKFQTVTMLSSLDWYIEIYARLRRMLLGNAGLLLIGFGFLVGIFHKKSRLFIAYMLAIASFFIIVAEGNYDTHYRQLTIVPAAAYFLAVGTISLYLVIKNFLSQQWSINTTSAGATAICICIGLLAITPVFKMERYLPRSKEFACHKPEWTLAQAIKEQVPGHQKIIMTGAYTIHKGGNDLSPIIYHYSGLTGWTLQEGEWTQNTIDNYEKKGATLLGALYYKREPELENFLQEMSRKYEVIYSNPEQQLLLLSLKDRKVTMD